MPLGEARNFGLAQCQGRFLAFLDTDDFWDLQKLEIQITKLKEGNFLFGYSGYNLVDENGQVFRQIKPTWRSGYVFGDLLMKYEVNIQTLVVDKGEWNSTEEILFDDALKFVEDLDLVMKMAVKGNACILPDYLASYRIHPNSMTSQNGELQGQELLVMQYKLLKNYPDLIQTFWPQWIMFKGKGNWVMAKDYFKKRRYWDGISLLMPCFSAWFVRAAMQIKRKLVN